jgi:hypothetical protein
MTVKEMSAELVALRDKMLKTSFFAMFRTRRRPSRASRAQ